MDVARIRASLGELESEVERARDAKQQMERDISAAASYAEPEEAFKFFLGRIYAILVVLLEVGDLLETRMLLIQQWEKFQKSGIGKTRYLPDYDSLESEPFEYLTTLINALRISVGEGLDPVESYELSKLESILRKTAVLVRRKVAPQVEQDVQEVMHDYLSAFFTEYRPSVRIAGIIRDFKPDCGIRNVKAAIEFKYAATQNEVSRAVSGIHEDISGYSGSQDWTRF